MRKILALVLALLATPALAQSTIQVPAGGVVGNSTASTRPARDETVTDILDRAMSSTRGSILRRGASGWAAVPPSATAGLPWVSAGTGADPLYQALTVAGGGTGITTLAIGDLLQASSTSALARLAAVATGNVLISGGVGTASSWGKVTSSHLNITTTSCTNQVMTALSATGTGTCSNVTLAMLNNVGATTTVLHGNAAGAPTFGAVVSADMNITTTSCTNQFVTAISSGGVGTCTTDALASAQHANQGTTTQLLHGNAAGNPSWAQLAFADIASGVIATASEYQAATASKLVSAAVIYPGEVTITFGATTTIDFATLSNGVVTLTGNITTLTLSNVTAGKAGQIRFIQDATGSRTWPAIGGNTILKYAGGALPPLSTAANAVDVLTYSCSTTTFCVASLLKDVRNP